MDIELFAGDLFHHPAQHARARAVGPRVTRIVQQRQIGFSLFGGVNDFLQRRVGERVTDAGRMRQQMADAFPPCSRQARTKSVTPL